MDALVETAPGASAPGKKRKSPRVRVRLPGDNALVGDIAMEVAHVLKGQHIFFRRAGMVVYLSRLEQKLEVMHPVKFRTKLEEYIVFYRSRYKETMGIFVDVDRSLNNSDSEAILINDHFLESLPRIRKVNPCPLPVMREDGTVEMLPRGYDAASGIYTF